ncbi:acyltransferase [Peribacillus frigoritolerans]|uniref:acyltransferase n=1 Tax=Peribacillus frigoritolerans TaxID=450367 RepID=UPI0021AA757D|nr:acyltransferase [Peribacillus frigoritolerans]MCT4478539.1 acyltransferase [Peribacillus frigoritolerans]
MRKYIRAVICLLYSFVKFCFIKLFHLKGFKFSIFNMVSPFTEIEIGKNGALSLGKMVRIRSGSKIRVRNGSKVEIGVNTSFNHGCMVISHEEVTIGNNTQFGPNVLIYDHDHDFRTDNGLKELKYKTSPIKIGNNVWIGANVMILQGTEIGDNCVVGAGSIIKGNFPNNSIIIQKRDTVINKIQKNI